MQNIPIFAALLKWPHDPTFYILRHITCPTLPLFSASMPKQSSDSANNQHQSAIYSSGHQNVIYCLNFITKIQQQNLESRLRGQLGDHPQLRIYQIFFGIRPNEYPLSLKSSI